ncbi:hypothetical protein Pla175_36720 [Pirellulimonas nuda]|uniref:DNA-binding domain-containing protein n=1 Tax=Pirellulimonas nuda TaxID=2528009 RepID=A0A518DFL6_9BACT|nr:hypothetical protein Pla175_36720 [Pirellulimonas nuda]
MLLGLEGWTAPAIATAVGLSRRICQRWAARYNAEGLAGLDDRRGREPRLPIDAEQEAAFRQRIEAGPAEGDEVCSVLRVYFQDESRFGQQGTNTNVWAEKGSRPTAVRQTEYEYLWVIGAVCPPASTGARRDTPKGSSARS